MAWSSMPQHEENWHNMPWTLIRKRGFKKLSSFLDCPLSRNLLWIFSWNLPGNFALKNSGIFGDFFVWSPFRTKRSTKTPQTIRGKFGAKFGAKSVTEIQKIRGTFVLQLFWPNSLSFSLWFPRIFPFSRNSYFSQVFFPIFRHPAANQKTREGCGCPNFPAGKVFRQISTLLEDDSPIFRQREMLSLPRFGHFPARKTAAGKLVAPVERCWIFSSETATAFVSSSEQKESGKSDRSIRKSDQKVTKMKGAWSPFADLLLRHTDFPKGPKIEKIQSRLEFSILLEIFNLAWNFQSRPSEFPTNNRGLVGGALEIFNLAWKFQDLEFFQSLGP